MSEDVEDDVAELLGDLDEYDDLESMLEDVADDVDVDLDEAGEFDSAFDD